MCNIGGWDKFLRIIVGLALISLVFFGEPIIGQNTVYGWLGLLPMMTGVFNFCFFYTLLGISTCKKK